jgi:sn-glycerol 3-phosphate transport system permease protein
MGTFFPNRYLPYLLLFPSIVLVLVFFILPAAQSLELSMYLASRTSDVRVFKGMENFTNLLQDSQYIESLRTTLTFIILVVVPALSLSLLLAVGASQPIRGFGIYRTLLIWTFALSPAIAGTIWALLTDPAIGIIPHYLDYFNIDFNWRTNAVHAIIFVSIAASWKILGYNIVFFLAGLKNIPQEVLDAASLDGANAWSRFWNMTFPLLSPITLFLLIMNTLYACFETFGLIDITTGGGPGRTTNILIYKLYRDGFVSQNRLGIASAQSILLLVFVVVLVFIQFRFVSRRTFYQ